MHQYRFRDLVSPGLPLRSAQPDVGPHAFLVCPPALLPNTPLALDLWRQVYQLAFAQAQAVNRPSLLDRDLLACWN